MNANREKLIDKIKKIMNIATDSSDSAFEGEIKIAMGIAQKLMAEHNISMNEVDTTSVNDPTQVKYEFEEQEAFAGMCPQFMGTVVLAIENICGVDAFKRKKYPHGNKVFFCGTPTDVAVARELFNLLYKMVQSRARAYAKKSGNSYDVFRSYAGGFSRALLIKSREKVNLEIEAKNNCYALVVVNKDQQLMAWKTLTYPGMRQGRAARVAGIHFSAYIQGKQDGSKVSLASKTTLK